MRMKASLLAICVACCDSRVRWDAHVLVRPFSGRWDQVDIHVQGSRPPGADIGDECEGRVTVAHKGITRTLEIRVTGTEHVVVATVPPGLVAERSPLNAAAVRAIGPAVSSAEAGDILRMVGTACAGPKAGFRTLPTLITVIAEQRYR